MFRSFRTFGLGLTVAVAACLPRLVMAELTIPSKGHADGQVTSQVDPTPDDPIGVQEYVVAGEGTLTGRFIGGGTTCFTADGDVAGEFLYTAADEGTTFFGSYTGTFFPLGDGLFGYEVVVTYEGGTGRLEGLGGMVDVVAVLDGLTGAFHYDVDGVAILP